MTTFVLLLAIIGGGGRPAVMSAEYANEAACRAAGEAARVEFNQLFGNSTRYVCTPGGVPRL